MYVPARSAIIIYDKNLHSDRKKVSSCIEICANLQRTIEVNMLKRKRPRLNVCLQVRVCTTSVLRELGLQQELLTIADFFPR
jgi:hypothetical protein